MSAPLRLALAQLNFCVGDINGNTAKIIEASRDAQTRKRAQLIAFPELAITGYPPEDLLFRPGLYRRVDAALGKIARESTGIAIVVGFPERSADGIYNSCAFCRNGKIEARYRKQQLPNYAVFDEKRYFLPGTQPCIVEVEGVKFSLSICEDIWRPDTAANARDAGADIILNINASPYHEQKNAERKAALLHAVQMGGLPIVYVNLVGGQDELIFDGGSMVVAADGEVVVAARSFESSIVSVEISRRPGGFAIRGVREPEVEAEQSIYSALVLGVRDYVEKNRFRGAVIGLSGGIDSALTLAIAVDALGAESVEALSMPSRYTAAMSVDDALEQARRLGCKCDVVSIEKPFSAFCEILEPLFKGYDPDVTEENMQARCRGLILMAISNKHGRIVLATGNKSEMSVGYATLYGDMVGGFAPLKDVPKTLVYRLAEWRNRRSEAIPRRVIDRPPSAELAPDQRDTDSLPPYEVLDPILERYIECDMTPREIAEDGFDFETVKRIVAMVDKNEYKRRQAAPGVRITRRAFGRDRRFPITSRYDERTPTDR